MKKLLMPATPLAAIKKMAFAILCATALMLVAAPARADACSAAFPVNGCGVTIVIGGTSGHLTAMISGGGQGTAYDQVEDQLVGITNGTSAVTVGAIVLSGPSTDEGDGLFGFDGDGPCVFFGTGSCAPTGYNGPFNTFVGINSKKSTGKVLFTTPLGPGQTTWFALEETPTSVVAIGENKSLTAGTTTFPFGPITQSGNTFTENATIDDYVITPLSALTGTDTMTVTAIPVPGGSFQPQSTFTNLSCIPYADFSAAAGSAQGNPDPVCVEVERDCFSTGTDCSTIIYTATLDFNIDKFSEPNGVGGAAFLGQDGAACPTFGFNHNITSSYTGSSVTDPLKGGSKDGGSCYVAAFDPTAAVVPAGKTVSTFFGFELPVLDSAVSPKFDGFKNPILPLEPLSWDSNNSSGTGLKGLQVCTAPNPDGSCSAPAGVGAFWVNLSSIPVANCGTFQGENNLPGTLLNSNNFPGEELFVWNTTKAKGVPKGCQVRVVLQFSQGGFQAPALFQYLKAQ